MLEEESVMKAKLALIRDAIKSAQNHLGGFKNACPQEFRDVPEVDEIEMGLEWTMKRVNKLDVQLDGRKSAQPGTQV